MKNKRSHSRAPALLTAAALALCIVFGGGCSSDSGSDDALLLALSSRTTQFKVKYETEHGTAPAEKTVDEGYALTEADLKEISADGYTFGGWHNGGTKASAGDKVTADITLKAEWTPTSYTITYNLNGGSFAGSYTAPSSYTIEEEVALPNAENVAKEKSAFKGWYESDGFSGGAVTRIEKGATGDKTYYAKWVESLYTVRYEGTDGAAYAEGVSPANGFTSEDTEIKLPTAEQISRDGYTFGGWYTDSTFTSEITSLTQSSAAKGETLTVHAKWTAISYKITYSLNDGKWAEGYTAPESYTVESGEITLPAAENITRTGYDFDGWYESSGFSGGAVAKIEKGTAENKAFYAKWSAGEVSYTVRHLLQPLSLSEAPKDYEEKDSESLSGYTDSRTEAGAKAYEGFTAKEITQETIAADGSTVVCVYYDRNTVTLSFDSDGGSEVATVSGKYGTKVTAPAEPEKDGYVFAGWEPALPETFGKDAEYKAVWSTTTAAISASAPVYTDKTGFLEADSEADPSKITFTATEGESFVWLVDGEKAGNAEKTFEMSVSGYSAGHHTVTLVIDGKYSATVQVEITK